MTPLRAGIVGGGWIARVHVPAIDAAPGVELVAACDVAADRAEAIAAPRGARAYTRWEDMLERFGQTDRLLLQDRRRWRHHRECLRTAHRQRRRNDTQQKNALFHIFLDR